MKLVRLSTVLLGFLFLLSCAPVNQKPRLRSAIVGKWRQIGGPARIELFKDGPSTMQFYREGTVIITGKKSSRAAWYDFPEEDQLRLQPKYGPRGGKEFGVIFKATLAGDSLTLADPAGKASAKFQRQE